jgi:DNA-binding CsgD family transcriptional regulator
VNILANLLETAVMVGDRDAAASLERALEGVPAVTAPISAVTRHRGAAAALLGNRIGALTHYQQALDWATRIRFRPEIALTRLAIAELLLDDHLARGLSSGERARALRERHPESPVPAPRPPLPGGLSERELEVLRRVAAGRSSQQIAEDLVLSIRTVESHITNIYRKLDVRTRAQATTFAHTHGLIAGD